MSRTSHLQIYKGRHGQTVILDNYLVSGPSPVGGETLIAEAKVDPKDIKTALGIKENKDAST